ncbi:MAG: hypothetical protein ABIQ19_09090 [Sphingomonas sp.]
MSQIAFDFLPDDMTQGEMAAIADATQDGWIIPPVYNCLRPAPPRPWRSVHLRYLERRGLTRRGRNRIDGVWCVRLNAEGLSLRGDIRGTTTRRELYALAGATLPERLAA